MASHPPPPSPRKLRSVIEAGMLNIATIPHQSRNSDFHPSAWELSYNIPTDMPDILKTVEHNFKNPKWELLDSAILNGDGWYLWQPTENQDNDYLVWLSAAQVKSGPIDWNNMDWMTLTTAGGTTRQAHGKQKYSIDGLIVSKVHQNDDWGHQNDFLYALILPTDENKMWIPISKTDNLAINFKRFPKVLLEGA